MVVQTPEGILEVRNATIRANRIEADSYKFDSTSNLEIGTANLFVDTTTSNVGIGTNLPLTALDVRGGITKTLYNPGEVIEELHSMCNKASLYGRATTQIVTSFQTLIDSYTDATGSVVTSYIPRVGTKIVLYEYHFQLSWNDDIHSIGHWRLYYQLNGGTWVEVQKARVTLSGQYPENKHTLRWAFEVGANANDSTLGIFTAATPMLGFKWQSRIYNTGNERSRLHSTRYFDGATSQQYSQPMVSIKAIA
jgi:hypothetical protein